VYAIDETSLDGAGKDRGGERQPGTQKRLTRPALIFSLFMVWTVMRPGGHPVVPTAGIKHLPNVSGAYRACALDLSAATPILHSNGNAPALPAPWELEKLHAEFQISPVTNGSVVERRWHDSSRDTRNGLKKQKLGVRI
jgi:hypothetical protein